MLYALELDENNIQHKVEEPHPHPQPEQTGK